MAVDYNPKGVQLPTVPFLFVSGIVLDPGSSLSLSLHICIITALSAFFVVLCGNVEMTASQALREQDSSKSVEKARPVFLHNNPRETKQIEENIFIGALRKMSRCNHKFPKFCFVLNLTVVYKYTIATFSGLKLVPLRS